MVALALASMFLLFVSMLEVSSLHGVAYLKRRAQAEGVAATVMNQVRAGWMRNHVTPKNGSTVLDGTTYSWQLQTKPAALGTDVQVDPAGAVAGEAWPGMVRLDLTVTWPQAEGQPQGTLLRTTLLTDTVPAPSPSPSGARP